MKLHIATVSVLVFCASVFAARTTVLQEKPAVKPGPEQEVLKHLVGTWDAAAQMGPTQEKGSMITTLGLGGMWTVSDYSGTIMGMPFLGHQILGWDTAKKKYVSCWVDSVTPSLALSEGTWDAAKKTLTLQALEEDAMTGTKPTMVFKVESADRHTFTMHAGGADTPEMMTITYTRKK